MNRKVPIRTFIKNISRKKICGTCEIRKLCVWSNM